MQKQSAWNIKLIKSSVRKGKIPDKNYWSSAVFIIFMSFSPFLSCRSQPLQTAVTADSDVAPDAVVIAAKTAETGQSYYLAGNFRAALPYFQQVLDFYQATDNLEQTAAYSGKIGWIYYSFAQYAQAESAFQLTFQAASTLASPELLAKSHYALGTVKFAVGKVEPAIEHYQQALTLTAQTGDQALTAECLSGLGTAFQTRGFYDKALAKFTRAFEINSQLKNDHAVSANLLEIAAIYNLWGLSEQSLTYYRQSRQLAESLNYKEIFARGLFLTGELYLQQRKYMQAEEYLTKSLAIARSTQNYPLTGSNLILLGKIACCTLQEAQALDYLNEAQSIAVITGNRLLLSRISSETGQVYMKLKDYEKALFVFNQSAALDEEMGIKDQMGEDYHNLGLVCLKLQQPKAAEEWLVKALAIKEQLRLTATSFTRRDYLASEIKTYHALISLYIQEKQPEKAFHYSELISARYLVEQLNTKNPQQETTVPFEAITVFQQELDEQTIVIKYFYTTDNTLLILLATKQELHTYQITPELFFDSIKTQVTEPFILPGDSTRGLSKIKLADFLSDSPEFNGDYSLEYLINYYHYLLAKQHPTSTEEKNRILLASGLYTLLLKPLAHFLVPGKELLIIPGATFSALPFETILLPDGSYCIEQYRIRYAQSLTLIKQIRQRSYSNPRKTLIAFGGAEYKSDDTWLPVVSDLMPISGLQNSIHKEAIQDSTLQDVYKTLGYTQWEELPGTLAEVKQIGQIIPDSRIVTGSQVNEADIKEFSTTGILRQYKQIHFATHALILPLLPDLSCLVLTPGDTLTSGNREDGYLTMAEISQLDIQAELVILSACETGLGRVYEGEGVVGLSQAFILAGANSVVVSLWKVADDATNDFMTGFYTLLANNPADYSHSLSAMKQECIKSTRYSTPFYWAPFVAYGI